MQTLSDLEVRLKARRREIDGLNGEARSVLTRAQAVKQEMDALTIEVDTLEKSGGVLNSLGEERQLKAQQTIEELVTRGLQEIFDDSLSFHIVQTIKAKNASVEFLVRSELDDGSSVETSVMDARGGGLAAVIGFLLRVVILLLKKGQDEDNILILDETFAHVSAEYLPGLSQFLRELVDKTGIQIIMVTHQTELTDNADVVYRFTNDNGQTKVEKQ